MISRFDPVRGEPRWYLIPVRVLLVTFVVSLLSFAISLFLGIGAVLLAAKLRAVHPDFRIAYRLVALPAASVVAAIVLISTSAMEIRHYRRTRTLNRMGRQIMGQHPEHQIGHAR